MVKSIVAALIFSFFFMCLGNIVTAQSMTLPGSSSSSPTASEGTPINFMTETTLKKQVDDIGLKVANDLMRCCSSYGGNNVYAQVDYDNCRTDSQTSTFYLPMKIGWTGSMSGNPYWIKGKLVVSKEGRQWLKISDSGGFQPSCSKNCIN